MGAQKTSKKTTKTPARKRPATPKQTTPAKPAAAVRPARKPKPQLEPALALKTTLFIPENRLKEALSASHGEQPPLLTHRVLKELMERDFKRGKVLLLLREKLLNQGTIFEVDLADLIASKGVRQLALAWTDQGWEVQVLPLWKHEFMTLVSLKKEKRHYLDIDRLISTITKHGPMPPTILIGKGKT